MREGGGGGERNWPEIVFVGKPPVPVPLYIQEAAWVLSLQHPGGLFPSNLGYLLKISQPKIL